MKNRIKIVFVTILFLILLLLTGYLLFVIYYSKGFGVNTWINGVYCTGKSVEEVNSELLSQIEAPIVIIKDDENEYAIDFATVGYEADFSLALHSYQRRQNAFCWLEDMSVYKAISLMPVTAYDEALLKEAFLTLPPIQAQIMRAQDFYLQYTEESGYRLYDGLSHRLDAEETFEQLTDLIATGQTVIAMEEIACFYDKPLSAEQWKLQFLWEKVGLKPH